MTVVLDRTETALSGAAAHQRRILDATDVRVVSKLSATTNAVESAAVVGDALVGYGLTDALRGRAAELVELANDSGAPLVSLDVPSGVNCLGVSALNFR
ncbi:NAD(P)H-hydrate epimerase [Halogeometricum borinquense]|uniref:NAD(P)H-hydrate epimerase n=1 Tax=Halogeometricum borinquense TaxID=60847 RepID=UPI00019E6E07|nr:NAD(P)H-hydrate epimerase [Halogeometricum borinquense]